MMRVRLHSALAFLFLFTLPSSGCAQQKRTFAAPNDLPSDITQSFGLNISFTEPRPGEIKMLADSGVRWVRMDFKWDLTETEKGKYDFTRYERLLSALDAGKLRALFILDYTNPHYDNGAPPRTEQTRQAFSRWAVAAAKHFSGRGIVWETYNEPNHPMFWKPQPSANEYAQLALAVGRAFRDAVPAEKLVGPATGEIDFPFLESCFKAGLLEYWSAVSIHPYRRTGPESAADDYGRLRELIKRYAPNKQVDIISSEWGYSSVWPGMNEETQGQMLARSWLTNAGNGISISIWYDWTDDGMNPNDAEHHFGIAGNAYHEGRAHVFDPKPAYRAAQTLTSFFRGYKFKERLATGRSDDYILVFSNGTQSRLAAWTSGEEHRVNIPVNERTFTRVMYTGKNLGSLTAANGRAAITLSTAPVYLKP